MAIVETQTFRLAQGTDESAFFTVDQRVQTELMYAQRGFLRRTTTRADDGEWFVINLWASLDDAEAAEAVAKDHDAQRALDALIDGSSMVVKRYSTLE